MSVDIYSVYACSQSVCQLMRCLYLCTVPNNLLGLMRGLSQSPDMVTCGAATILPVSCIFCRCAVISKTLRFDYGEDSVVVAVLCGSKYSM